MRMRHIVVLLPARIYNITPHYLIKGMILKKKFIEHQVCILFPMQLLRKWPARRPH